MFAINPRSWFRGVLEQFSAPPPPPPPPVMSYNEFQRHLDDVNERLLLLEKDHKFYKKQDAKASHPAYVSESTAQIADEHFRG